MRRNTVCRLGVCLLLVVLVWRISTIPKHSSTDNREKHQSAAKLHAVAVHEQNQKHDIHHPEEELQLTTTEEPEVIIKRNENPFMVEPDVAVPVAANQGHGEKQKNEDDGFVVIGSLTTAEVTAAFGIVPSVNGPVHLLSTRHQAQQSNNLLMRSFTGRMVLCGSDDIGQRIVEHFFSRGTAVAVTEDYHNLFQGVSQRRAGAAAEEEAVLSFAVGNHNSSQSEECGVLVHHLTPTEDFCTDDEGAYKVRVTLSSCVVHVSSWRGLLHALHTLLQLSLNAKLDAGATPADVVQSPTSAKVEESALDMNRVPPLKHDLVRLLTGYDNGGEHSKESLVESGTRNDGGNTPSEKRPQIVAQWILDISRRPSLKIPCVEFSDEPRFNAWRGQHMDSARHFQPISTMKEVLSAMHRRKMNILHWHLTDDQGWRLPSIMFPSLAKVGGRRGPTLNGKKYVKFNGQAYLEPQYYKVEEIWDILKYAKVRGIMVVPEIDMPAHATGLIMALQHELFLVRGLATGKRFKTRIDKLRKALLKGEVPNKNITTHDQTGKEGAKGVRQQHREKLFASMGHRVFTLAGYLVKDGPFPEPARGNHHFGFIQNGNEDCGLSIPQQDPVSPEEAKNFHHAHSEEDIKKSSVSFGSVNCFGGTHGILFPTSYTLAAIEIILIETALIFDVVDRNEDSSLCEASSSLFLKAREKGFFHLGGDQAEFIREKGWNGKVFSIKQLQDGAPHRSKDEEAEGKSNKRQQEDVDATDDDSPALLHSALMNLLCKFVLTDLDRHPIMWDDTLIETPIGASPPPPGTWTMLWRDDRVSWGIIEKRIAAAAAFHFKTSAPTRNQLAQYPVIFAGKTRFYFDYQQYAPETKNKFRPLGVPASWLTYRAVTLHRVAHAGFTLPLPHWTTENYKRSTTSSTQADQDAAIPPGSHFIALAGVESCLWSELIFEPAKLRYQLHPRMAAVADVGWRSRQYTAEHQATKQNSSPFTMSTILMKINVPKHDPEATAVEFLLSGEANF